MGTLPGHFPHRIRHEIGVGGPFKSDSFVLSGVYLLYLLSMRTPVSSAVLTRLRRFKLILAIGMREMSIEVRLGH